MSEAAIISASLVDVRNIAAHKCVRLEIHVPVEQAPLVMAAFGWPTMADPVPVAIARLQPEPAQRAPEARQVASGDKPRREFHLLPYAQQAALKCGDKGFQRFLGVLNEHEAAIKVREECGVRSRAEIESDEQAKNRWHGIMRDFDQYQRGFR